MARTHILVLAVAFTLAALVGAGKVEKTIGKLNFSKDVDGKIKLTVNRQVGDVSFDLGQNLGAENLARARYEEISGGIMVDFGQNTKLEIKAVGECSEVTWTTDQLTSIQDCVNYGTAHWYGGFEQKDQRWPIEKLEHQNYQYVTQELDNMGIAERYFLNSYGDYIFIEDYVPLFLDFNTTGQNNLCFTSKFEDPFLAVPLLRLHYRICTLGNARSAQLHAIENALGKPSNTLGDERLMQHPIWSTWVRYKRNINQTIVLDFAREIAAQGYQNSQIEIDDDWETCYGELVFDNAKFPDPAGMVTELRSLGFRVTMWMHPFMNENCPSFAAAKALGYFAKDENGRTRTRWWNGLFAAIVDFTNPEATNWWLGKVNAIKELTQVDSFKFDAGETSWLPKPRILSDPVELQPNMYTSLYIRNLTRYGPLTEIRAGFRTQDVPLFVRMVDKDSRWTMNNGLRSIVTTLLAMNMAGYPYVLPDMIGGNSYAGEVITKELFIRWLQASTFMPAIQFSAVPWDYNDPEVDAICKKFVDLHANYTSVFVELAEKYVNGSSLPINNPIWLASPYVYDEQAFLIDDEYLLGTSILVAPVMDEGAVSRDIYLPDGIWRDMNTQQVYVGPNWLRNYPAPLDTLPYFEIAVMNGAINVATNMALTTLLFVAIFLLN